MKQIADLHIHSRFSMATSKDGTMEMLDLWARKKGITLIGTGDMTHPLWRQELKEKLAKKKQKVIDVKEVRMSPNIDTNDLNTKINHAKKFLAKGARVKVTLRFRGRELAHVNASKYILDDFAKALEDVATIDKKPKFEGRSMTMFLAPKNN